MRRLATYAWSLSVGLVGFFLGLAFLASFHTFEKWQVGFAGLLSAIALAIPTAIAVSRVLATAPRPATTLLAYTGFAFLLAMLLAYSQAVLR